EATTALRPHEPLRCYVNGRAVATGYTDGYIACTASVALGLAPGSYPVRAVFAGDPRYLPSEGAGTLRVVQPAALLVAPPPVAGVLSLPPGPYPLSAPAPGPAPGVEAQAVPQAAAQAQAAAQPQAGL